MLTDRCKKLPLRGKTSPAPGEDVTIGDKKGNLARERLRGFVPNPFCEKGVLKSPQTFQNPKIQNIFSAEYAQSKRGAHSDGFLPRIHKGVAAVHCHKICRHEAPDDGLAQDDGIVGVARDEHQHKDHLAH